MFVTVSKSSFACGFYEIHRSFSYKIMKRNICYISAIQQNKYKKLNVISLIKKTKIKQPKSYGLDNFLLLVSIHYCWVTFLFSWERIMLACIHKRIFYAKSIMLRKKKPASHIISKSISSVLIEDADIPSPEQNLIIFYQNNRAKWT